MDFYLRKTNEYIFEIVDREENTYFRYDYNPSNKLCVQTWFKEILDEEIIQIYKIVSKYAFENKQPMTTSITHVINIQNSFHLTNEWVVAKFLPKAIEGGYKYAFFVRSEAFIAQLALEDAVEKLNTLEGLREARIFDTLQEAIFYANQGIVAKNS